MAAVFPESMNRLDREDTAGSFGILENYIRYMIERIEFSNKNMTRTVSAAGTSSVEVLQNLLELASAVAVMQSTVSGMVGDLTGLGTRLTGTEEDLAELTGRMDRAEEDLTALAGRMSTAEGTLTELTGRMSTAEGALETQQKTTEDLAARVAALEGGNGTDGND